MLRPLESTALERHQHRLVLSIPSPAWFDLRQGGRAPGCPDSGMDPWIDIAKWLAGVIGVVAVLGASIVAAMAWMLNHSD